MASEDRGDVMLPTLALTGDPRLRRLFALVGKGLADEGDFTDVEDDLYEIMLDVAPEYVVPDLTDDPRLREKWEAMIAEGLG